MNAPRKSKTVDNDLEIERAIQSDFEHEYYCDEHLESVPPIIEGLGFETE